MSLQKQAITWHHTATPSRPAGKAIAGIRRYHVEERGWEDVAYHIFIDADGKLWPGRALDRDPDTHSDIDVSGHIFVAVLGDFEKEHPTRAAVRTLDWVIYLLTTLFDVPLSLVRPHGDIANTRCPGRYLRAAVEAL